jgi:hypothetical protein
MVETAIPSPSPIASGVKPARPSVPTPEREVLNPDGSAVPDIIAYHHRPEDIGDLSNQDVPDDEGNGGNLFGTDGLTFGDFLDVINPLQHIPIVSTIYREMTGDDISPGARVAGGALFGGPIGLAVAAVNAIVESTTGDDIGENLIAAFTDVSDELASEPAAETTATKKVVTVAEAGPLVMGAGLSPTGLIAHQASPSAPSITPPPAATPSQTRPANFPFGGVSIMPNGKAPFGPIPTNSEKQNDPVAALLHARAAVPLAGPIQGLGNQSRARAIEQLTLPTISTKLGDRLSALAARTASSQALRQDNGKTGPLDHAPLSAAQMPQRMSDALDRYEQMKKLKPVSR